MNSTQLAKIAGWGQFLFQILGQTIAAGGLPTSPLAWFMLVSSVGTAIATHAAAVSPGTPSK